MFYKKKIWCLLLLNTLITVEVLASESSTDIDNKIPYANLPLGGPTSVTMQIAQDSEVKGDFSILPTMSSDYSQFKKRIDEAYGLSFGFDYNVLLQSASQSPAEKYGSGWRFPNVWRMVSQQF